MRVFIDRRRVYVDVFVDILLGEAFAKGKVLARER
jgi:hypothetical protein